MQQNITLHIYDMDIPVTVSREDEHAWREAANLINDRLNAYFASYKGRKSDKEVMYFAMIDIALNCVRSKEGNDVKPFQQALETLSAEIADALK